MRQEDGRISSMAGREALYNDRRELSSIPEHSAVGMDEKLMRVGDRGEI